MLGKRFSGNHFFQIFYFLGRPQTPARGLRAFDRRGRTADPRTCRESMPVRPPKVILPRTYAYAIHA